MMSSSLTDGLLLGKALKRSRFNVGLLHQVTLDGYSKASSPASWKEHIVLVLPLPTKYSTKEGVTDHW